MNSGKSCDVASGCDYNSNEAVLYITNVNVSSIINGDAARGEKPCRHTDAICATKGGSTGTSAAS